MSIRTALTRHLDQIGAGGSVFAALCCLGTPAIVAVLSAMGLGFLLRDAILIPLLVAFLLATVAGLYLGVRHHGRRTVFIVGVAGALVTLLAIVLAGSGALAAIGVALLIGASLLNVWLRARRPGTR
jgi:mercuric ion transport protein